MSDHKTVMIAVDFSPRSDIAISHGFALAEALGSVERIHIVHIARPPVMWTMPPGFGGALALTPEAITAGAKERLDAFATPDTSITTTRAVRFGGAAEELAAEATDTGADLIVLATRDRGALARWVLGSVASALVRGAPCPVLVVSGDRAPLSLRRVVASIDLSSASKPVITEALRVAKASGATLEVLSVFQPPTWLPGPDFSPHRASPEEEASLREAYRQELGRQVASIAGDQTSIGRVLVEGDEPAGAIVEHAERSAADLIVLGSSGHNAWQRLFLGSTATKVLEAAKCSILILPAGSA
jgi:nucleotide-binding universal stress UspA family protein